MCAQTGKSLTLPGHSFPTATHTHPRAYELLAACSQAPEATTAICDEQIILALALDHTVILWMDEILHHFETMVNQCWVVITGESSFLSFFGVQDFVHPGTNPHLRGHLACELSPPSLRLRLPAASMPSAGTRLPAGTAGKGRRPATRRKMRQELGGAKYGLNTTFTREESS